ncbi:MAG TPA: hypothetical protein DCY86_09015 [Bdellovibrionales bacterium]|nr:hypothetical protein [Bdellovibrionales bacterium]
MLLGKLMKTAVFFFFALTFSLAATGKTSALWGQHGELWKKDRLPDFTTAGYKGGKVELPDFKKTIDVKKLGAIGDGKADDTKFFEKAIRKCSGHAAIFVPNGTYLIATPLLVKTSHCALVGEDEGKTKIFFPKGLEEIQPKFDGEHTTWSWEGGMITFFGNGLGIQNLTIQFPDNVWEGHNFHERGYNGIGFQETTDGWLKNVTITGADLGLWISRKSSHITIDHLTLNFGPKRNEQTLMGHHGLNVYGGHNLISNFEIAGQFKHDLSVESKFSIYNVFMKGKAKDLSIDHHSQDYNQKYNLWTEIDAGQGSRLYHSGGKNVPRGVSFNETYWNIKSQIPVPWVTSMGISRNNNAVGLNASGIEAMVDQYNNWFELISPADIEPKNIYTAQMNYAHN